MAGVSTDAGPEPADSELIARAREGEREAFALLYRRHQAVVYRFARAMTGSDSTAEDIVQEVFLALMRNLERYDSSRATLSTYLFGVARNIARHRARGVRRLTSLESAGDAVAVDNPSARLVQSDRVRHVRAGIALLPVRYREVILLCDVHDLSYEDAAAALKVPVGTVRSRLHRARQHLLERLRRREELPSRIQVARRWVI
jgi:RNA polymerase sigma-70 factor (ECF subfamily)